LFPDSEHVFLMGNIRVITVVFPDGYNLLFFAVTPRKLEEADAFKIIAKNGLEGAFEKLRYILY